MSEQTYVGLLIGWLVLAILLIPIQVIVSPPYGRHRRNGWGPQLDNRLGWIVMEIVAPVAFVLSLFWERSPTSKTVWIILALWLGHYIHRSLIYPVRIKTSDRRIPLLIVGAAILFNLFNGWSNGFYLSTNWTIYPDDWLLDPRFMVGLVVFFIGATINLWSDYRLIALREPGRQGYVIPHGGLFEHVSCPNHLGEIIEWIGFAILCWNLPSLAFAVWTAANLGPRAWNHHRWYIKTFPDYPKDRRALIPHIL